MYDGLADLPRLLGPGAVADIAQGLDAIDVGALLADLLASPAEAAVCAASARGSSAPSAPTWSDNSL
ncbi:hypothetical protein [Streptomyces sp. NPDC102476]|uniref:hypothetical protein n=1 Tax=Streptomyces sp. NPDC102476 TaxID=3366181 RepID=UPI0037FF2E0A